MSLILPKQGLFEYEEKRSKFLALCAPISTEEESRGVIAEIRAAHPRANHNVFAYSITKGNIQRISDDGEPRGTAGMPVLNVFQKTGIIDFVCVVTRYFGGTLLGASGLVRSYASAAKGAMENAAPTELVISNIYHVVCPYANFDKVKYKFKKLDIEIIQISYTEICTIQVCVKEAHTLQFMQGVGYTIF